ncbi:hypothetical protein V5F77_16200 [Xanthobacter sp. DSM 24535]|uniref:hypothetical protein n=1 Tax=Roseixanthobacter psychrophilus TaxID=3119917 RepID=UPI003729103F
MRKFTLATAAFLALSTIGASAQMSGTTAGQDPHKGPAQEGGRTQATPGVTPKSGATPMDAASTPTPRSGTSAGNPQAGPAQEGGRAQATPGGSSTSGGVIDSTGSITPRSGTAAGQDPHKGPAQEGGRTQATPGATR